jgi:hypothetical protein
LPSSVIRWPIYDARQPSSASGKITPVSTEATAYGPLWLRPVRQRRTSSSVGMSRARTTRPPGSLSGNTEIGRSTADTGPVRIAFKAAIRPWSAVDRRWSNRLSVVVLGSDPPAGVCIPIVIRRVPGQDLGQSVDLLDWAVDLTLLRAADRNVRQRPHGEMARRAQGISPCVGSWEQAIAGTPPRTPHPASVTHPSSSVTRPFPRMQAKDSRRGDASVPASHTPRIPTQSLASIREKARLPSRRARPWANPWSGMARPPWQVTQL